MRAKGHPLVKARYAVCPPGDVVTCSVVVGELLYGAERSSNPPAERAKVDAFLAPLVSLPFDDAAARVFAQVRAHLDAQGLGISPLDTMIAAIALAHGLTVVTHNTTEFGRVPGLALDDWEVP